MACETLIDVSARVLCHVATQELNDSLREQELLLSLTAESLVDQDLVPPANCDGEADHVPTTYDETTKKRRKAKTTPSSAITRISARGRSGSYVGTAIELVQRPR